jgi:tetratricopeptide (TPR) repeat protein
MPPWKPEPGHGDFAGARRLTEDEIARIQEWVAQGRQPGDVKDLPPEPTWPSGWTLGEPDMVLTFPTPYLLRSDGPDVFRTFVVPIPLSDLRYVRALEFDPGSSKAIHHANLKVDATRSSRWLDEQEPGPGYEGAGARGAKFPDGYFLGWTPGQSPRTAPEGLSWRLEPSSDLVVELHMMPTGREERVQPRIALYFTNQPPVRLPYMIRLGRQDLDIPAGASRYVATDSYVLPVDVAVIAVQPHAHWLARRVLGFAALPDGRAKWLVDIRDWDFRWQDVYRLREPLALPKGTRLTMEYTYDNSAGNVRNPFSPPRRVTFGQTSSSEMGDLWLQVMTSGDEDRRRLDEDFAPKMLREDIAGIEKMLEISPHDPRLHADLGLCYLEAGRPDDGLAHLEEAARLEPASPGAQHDVGAVLLRQRRFEEARAYFDAAIRLKPDFAEAYANLGVVSHLEGRLPEAAALYAKAIALDPGNAEAEYNLGRALVSLAQPDAALDHFQRSLRINPNDAATHASVGSLLASRQRVEDAVVHYRRALALDPDLKAALVDLAWILATSSSLDIRSPSEAARLAERAVRLTEGQSPTALDTLAAAYASKGELDRAIATAEQALALASASGLQELAEHIRARLDVYKQKQ